MATAALNGPAVTAAPPPVSLPLRAVLPPRPIAAGLLVAGLGAFAISALRPKQVPKQVQLAADAVTGTVVALHPAEAYLIRRRVAKKNVTRGTVRTSTLSTLVFGIFGSFPALRAIKRATR